MSYPSVLRWVPGRVLPSEPRALVVGTRRGEVLLVDPDLGTCETLATGLGEITAIDVHPNGTQYAAASQDGRLVVGTLAGERVRELRHPFRECEQVLLVERHLLVVGDVLDARASTVFSLATGETVGRVRLPARVIVSVVSSGRPILCRSTETGLDVIPLERGRTFLRRDTSTPHRLLSSGRFVLGVDGRKTCLWDTNDGALQTLRLPDVVSGAVSADGRWLGLGTAGGAVSLMEVAQLGERRRPDLLRAFRDPVTCVAFAPGNRWLATGAETLRLWTWEVDARQNRPPDE